MPTLPTLTKEQAAGAHSWFFAHLFGPPHALVVRLPAAIAKATAAMEEPANAAAVKTAVDAAAGNMMLLMSVRTPSDAVVRGGES